MRPSVRQSGRGQPQRAELAALAEAAANWLVDAWFGAADKATRSHFYAERFSDCMEKRFAPPYWRELELQTDRTAIAYPEVRPFQGQVNPAYADPLRQPTDCRYTSYSRLYNTPVYPSFGNDKSPGWQGEVQAGKFRDLWHAVRIQEFAIPAGQRQDTSRPISLHLDITIEASATIRGNKIWFVPLTRARVRNSPWTPGVSDKVLTHFYPTWQTSSAIPGDSPGGWSHDAIMSLWRYGSWQSIEFQWKQGSVLLIEVATIPSLGRYYSRNDQITVTNDETVRVWWPQRPGEL